MAKKVFVSDGELFYIDNDKKIHIDDYSSSVVQISVLTLRQFNSDFVINGKALVIDDIVVLTSDGKVYVSSLSEDNAERTVQMSLLNVYDGTVPLVCDFDQEPIKPKKIVMNSEPKIKKTLVEKHIIFLLDDSNNLYTGHYNPMFRHNVAFSLIATM